MQSTWNPDQYERFRAERSQPFFDLMALVRPRPDMRVVDLGCGTGELTQTLHKRLGARTTLGLDNAETMLARSDAFAADGNAADGDTAAGLRFVLGEIGAFAAEPSNRHSFDLVFSNAALQWVPDHRRLFARLTALLAEGGQLAVQVPANYDHPSHVVASELAAEEPFRAALTPEGHAPDEHAPDEHAPDEHMPSGVMQQRPVLAPEEYAALLHTLGYQEQHVRLQVYGHLLPDWSAVVEWVKGTLLTAYKRRLPPELYDLFLDRYRERLGARLDHASPYFYPFKRILLWGQQ